MESVEEKKSFVYMNDKINRQDKKIYKRLRMVQYVIEQSKTTFSCPYLLLKFTTFVYEINRLIINQICKCKRIKTVDPFVNL